MPTAQESVYVAHAHAQLLKPLLYGASQTPCTHTHTRSLPLRPHDSALQPQPTAPQLLSMHVCMCAQHGRAEAASEPTLALGAADTTPALSRGPGSGLPAEHPSRVPLAVALPGSPPGTLCIRSQNTQSRSLPGAPCCGPAGTPAPCAGDVTLCCGGRGGLRIACFVRLTL